MMSIFNISEFKQFPIADQSLLNAKIGHQISCRTCAAVIVNQQKQLLLVIQHALIFVSSSSKNT